MIRHAATDQVNARILAGRAEGVFLNEQGRQEALKLAGRLTNVPLSAVYSSPLERAVETAETIAQAFDLRVETREEFEELDLGDWTGRNYDELEADNMWRNFNSFRSSTRVPNGELMMEAQVRAVNGIEKLCTVHQGEAVAVVSHADIVKAAIAHYAGVHLDLFHRIEISPASISILWRRNGTSRIMAVNHAGDIAGYLDV